MSGDRRGSRGSTMTVKELGHVVLYVGDMERSAAFYRDVLGWEAVFPATLGMPVAAFSSGRTHHELPPHRGRAGRRPSATGSASGALSHRIEGR